MQFTHIVHLVSVALFFGVDLFFFLVDFIRKNLFFVHHLQHTLLFGRSLLLLRKRSIRIWERWLKWSNVHSWDHGWWIRDLHMLSLAIAHCVRLSLSRAVTQNWLARWGDFDIHWWFRRFLFLLGSLLFLSPNCLHNFDWFSWLLFLIDLSLGFWDDCGHIEA